MYCPKTFAELTPAERVEACYQHSIIKCFSSGGMTNTSLRERFKMHEKQSFVGYQGSVSATQSPRTLIMRRKVVHIASLPRDSFVGTSQPRQPHPASIDGPKYRRRCCPRTSPPSPGILRHGHKVKAERCARWVVGPEQRSRQALHYMA